MGREALVSARGRCDAVCSLRGVDLDLIVAQKVAAAAPASPLMPPPTPGWRPICLDAVAMRRCRRSERCNAAPQQHPCSTLPVTNRPDSWRLHASCSAGRRHARAAPACSCRNPSSREGMERNELNVALQTCGRGNVVSSGSGKRGGALEGGQHGPRGIRRAVPQIKAARQWGKNHAVQVGLQVLQMQGDPCIKRCDRLNSLCSGTQ